MDLFLYFYSIFILAFADKKKSSSFADGTVHNLNEYINMSVADAITDVTISSVKDVIFTQKNGVVIKDNQLEEFICQLSSLE